MASADLDHDGESELIAGFAGGDGGPFLRWIPTGSRATSPDGQRLALPIRPDFIAVLDFDADGHADVVVAERRGPGALLLSGDGTGRLAPTGILAADRTIEALTSGDVNRSDGLGDLLLAVAAQGRHALLVFESPDGASRATPEEIPLDGEAAAIAVGRLSPGPFTDVAIACGESLRFVRGRDRRLGMDGLGRSLAPPPVVETSKLPSPAVGVATGRFVPGEVGPLDLMVLEADGAIEVRAGKGGEAIAISAPPLSGPLVAAKLTSDAGDQFLARRREDGAWTALAVRATEDGTLAAAPARRAPTIDPSIGVVLPVRLDGAGLDRLVSWQDSGAQPSQVPVALSATFTVNTTADTHDAAPGDGTCADTGGFCSLRAAIEEADALSGTDTIDFALGSGTPTLVPATSLPTITETLSILGDTGGATRIEIAGSLAGGGATGLRLGSASPATSAGSLLRALVINRFGGPGIAVETSSNAIVGSFVGPDKVGGGSVAGNGEGIVLIGAAAYGNTVGGATAAQADVVSGNAGAGIRIDSGAWSNTVAGCFVGTSATGTVALPNAGAGILIAGGSYGNTLGGAVATPGSPPGNVVSGNAAAGIEMVGGGTSGNLAQGSLVGLAAGGSSPLGNGSDGLRLHAGAGAETIGGSAASLRNVVSSNGPGNPSADGVEINGSSDNAIRGCFIGLDAAGSAPRGNGGDGIAIRDTEGSSTGNVVGGTGMAIAGSFSPDGGLGPRAIAATSSTNTVSSNSGSGVRVSGSGSTSNTVAGNDVGTTSSGVITIVPGNLGDGIVIEAGASMNVIGGTVGVTPGDCTGACNRIAHSFAAGITVRDASSVKNTIRGNVIASNATLGIDLGADGVTPNDPGDSDLGPNRRQNFPVIRASSFDGVSTRIDGTLDSVPSASFDLEFFANLVPDASGYGEGRFFLGSIPLSTDPSGHAAFTFFAAGHQVYLSATATDAAGNTSEFGPTFSNPGEAGLLTQSKGPGSSLSVSFSPACGATDHAIYWGVTPFAGGVSWTAVACGLGATGSASYDPGTPPAGKLFYSVVVGQNATIEGAYGDARPEATFPSSCNLPQGLPLSCP
jgi:CSLREA domain-containing protein